MFLISKDTGYKLVSVVKLTQVLGESLDYDFSDKESMGLVSSTLSYIDTHTLSGVKDEYFIDEVDVDTNNNVRDLYVGGKILLDLTSEIYKLTHGY